jgi:quercetin dioxygenase-like cupin family protein
VKIRRFVTAEKPDGTVLVRLDEPIPDTDSAVPATVLWGWDEPPTLPIRPDDLGEDHVKRPLFPATGGASVNLIVFAPATQTPAEPVDMGNAEIVTGGSSNMHRTDSVDFAFVLEGEVLLHHPGAGEPITLRRGDFIVQNGAMHEWEHRSPERCVMACVVLTTRRDGAD